MTKEVFDIEITHCSLQDNKKWNAFIDTFPSSSFYHLFEWKNIIEECLGHKTYYLAATQNNKFSGVLPLIYIDSLIFGKILCSMPFLNYGGICAEDIKTETALLAEAKSIVAKNNIAYLELRNRKKLTESMPTSTEKVSMTLSLHANSEEIWSNFKSKQRTAIRRAYKNNLHVEHGADEYLSHFYEVMAKSWKMLGTPIYRKNLFYKILQSFPDKTKIFVVYHNDAPVAAAFNGYHNGIIEGMWLGTDPDFRSLNASYPLYWEMIKHGCENGYRLFHFGRSSMESGGEFFKKKWDADTKQLYWQYHLGTIDRIPQLNVRNPKYQLAIKLWKKLPLKLTTLIGHQIAKNIP